MQTPAKHRAAAPFPLELLIIAVIPTQVGTAIATRRQIGIAHGVDVGQRQPKHCRVGADLGFQPFRLIERTDPLEARSKRLNHPQAQKEQLQLWIPSVRAARKRLLDADVLRPSRIGKFKRRTAHLDKRRHRRFVVAMDKQVQNSLSNSLAGIVVLIYAIEPSRHEVHTRCVRYIEEPFDILYLPEDRALAILTVYKLGVRIVVEEASADCKGVLVRDQQCQIGVKAQLIDKTEILLRGLVKRNLRAPKDPLGFKNVKLCS